jgi:hypothetical protein
LSGSLPFELALLPNLTVVLLDDNEIQGSIPESWSTMSNLERLELRGNGLTGTFPESILLNNPKLETIILGSNSFTGTIPTLIGSVSLIDLRLEGNRFNGTIPTEIASISSLRKFCSTFFLCCHSILSDADAHSRRIVCSLSTEFLDLDANNLQGTIPVGIYSLPSLARLSVNDNAGITGNIPDDVGQASMLQELRLGGTQIGGTLPEMLFSLVELIELNLAFASFSGNLSDSFVNLQAVLRLHLNNNTFTGSIPTALDGLTNLSK